MYYFLNKVIMDEKKHFFFRGVLYNGNKSQVNEGFDGSTIHEGLIDPFLLVLNDSTALTKNRELTDKISAASQGIGLLFLISPKAQKLFEELIPKDVKLFKATIKGSNFELHDYKIVKILDKIDCVDLDKSVLNYDLEYDSIDSAKTIVLKDEKIPPGKQIFLLAKRETAVIMIHNDLKVAIEKAGLTGFKFYNLDEAYRVIA